MSSDEFFQFAFYAVLIVLVGVLFGSCVERDTYVKHMNSAYKQCVMETIDVP